MINLPHRVNSERRIKRRRTKRNTRLWKISIMCDVFGACVARGNGNISREKAFKKHYYIIFFYNPLNWGERGKSWRLWEKLRNNQCLKGCVASELSRTVYTYNCTQNIKKQLRNCNESSLLFLDEFESGSYFRKIYWKRA